MMAWASRPGDVPRMIEPRAEANGHAPGASRKPSALGNGTDVPSSKKPQSQRGTCGLDVRSKAPRSTSALLRAGSRGPPAKERRPPRR